MENQTNESEIFSLLLVKGDSWEGYTTSFIGTFQTYDGAVEGFMNWIENGRRIVDRKSKKTLVNTLKRDVGERENFSPLEEQSHISSTRKERENRLNSVLNDFNYLFGCGTVHLEIKNHKFNDVLF